MAIKQKLWEWLGDMAAGIVGGSEDGPTLKDELRLFRVEFYSAYLLLRGWVFLIARKVLKWEAILLTLGWIVGYAAVLMDADLHDKTADRARAAVNAREWAVFAARIPWDLGKAALVFFGEELALWNIDTPLASSVANGPEYVKGEIKAKWGAAEIERKRKAGIQRWAKRGKLYEDQEAEIKTLEDQGRKAEAKAKQDALDDMFRKDFAKAREEILDIPCSEEQKHPSVIQIPANAFETSDVNMQKSIGFYNPGEQIHTTGEIRPDGSSFIVLYSGKPLIVGLSQFCNPALPAATN